MTDASRGGNPEYFKRENKGRPGQKKAKVPRKRKLQTIQAPKKLVDFLRDNSEDIANQNLNGSTHDGLKVVI